MRPVADLALVRLQQHFSLTPQLGRLLIVLHAARGGALGPAYLSHAMHVGRIGSEPNPDLVRYRIRDLRLALGEKGRAVETVRGLGYRLRPGIIAMPSAAETAAPAARSATPGQVVRQIEWGAAQAWPVAAAVAARHSGVPLAQIIARTVPGQKRPLAVTDARALAIALAVIGGAASRRALSRVTGFDLAFIKKTLAAFSAAREADDGLDALLARLEAEVLDQVQAAHERPLGAPPAEAAQVAA